jgi:nuclear transport factor 2 (NTF2) superfamily protein
MPTTSATQAKQQKAAEDALNGRINSEMASAYFEDIAPAQATAQRDLNNLALQQQGNEVDRGRNREQQYRQIASKYASRGMRGPTQAVETANYEADLTKSRTNEARAMSNAKGAYQERFGAGNQAEDFFANPTLYGTVGTAARRAALARLQQQGINYTNVGA